MDGYEYEAWLNGGCVAAECGCGTYGRGEEGGTGEDGAKLVCDCGYDWGTIGGGAAEAF